MYILYDFSGYNPNILLWSIDRYIVSFVKQIQILFKNVVNLSNVKVSYYKGKEELKNEEEDLYNIESSVKLWLLSPKLPQELDDKVDDLNTTEDGESGKKPHGASNETQGGLQGHLHVFLNLVVGGSAKVDLNHFKSLWILNVGS